MNLRLVTGLVGLAGFALASCSKETQLGPVGEDQKPPPRKAPEPPTRPTPPTPSSDPPNVTINEALQKCLGIFAYSDAEIEALCPTRLSGATPTDAAAPTESSLCQSITGVRTETMEALNAASLVSIWDLLSGSGTIGAAGLMHYFMYPVYNSERVHVHDYEEADMIIVLGGSYSSVLAYAQAGDFYLEGSMGFDEHLPPEFGRFGNFPSDHLRCRYTRATFPQGTAENFTVAWGAWDEAAGKRLYSHNLQGSIRRNVENNSIANLFFYTYDDRRFGHFVTEEFTPETHDMGAFAATADRVMNGGISTTETLARSRNLHASATGSALSVLEWENAIGWETRRR